MCSFHLVADLLQHLEDKLPAYAAASLNFELLLNTLFAEDKETYIEHEVAWLNAFLENKLAQEVRSTREPEFDPARADR